LLPSFPYPSRHDPVQLKAFLATASSMLQPPPRGMTQDSMDEVETLEDALVLHDHNSILPEG
jgi:hypothetical protein